MRLINHTGVGTILNHDCIAENISYIGSMFDLPEITQESIDNAEGGYEYVTFYFDGEYLPDVVKAALYESAKAEIERNTLCGELPDALIGGRKYILDAITDEKSGAITDVRIGCELLLADDWKQYRGANGYKQFINRNLQYGYTNNLTKMCAGYSAIDAILWNAAELTTLQKIVDVVMNADDLEGKDED